MLAFQPMAIRNLTQDFVNLRDQSHFYSTQYEEQKKLLPPQTENYLNTKTLFQTEIQTVKALLRKLESLETQKFYTLFGSFTKQNDLENTVASIKHLLQKCRKLCSCIPIFEFPTNQEQIAINNVQKSMLNDLMDVTQLFRKQQVYYAKCLQKHNCMEDLDIQKDWIIEDENKEKHQYNNETILLLANDVDENAQMLEERQRELDFVLRDIVDLKDMMDDFHIMLSNQGHMIERIDYNLEHCKVYVSDANQNLTVADKTQNKGNRVVCGVLAVLLLLFIVGIIALAIRIVLS